MTIPFSAVANLPDLERIQVGDLFLVADGACKRAVVLLHIQDDQTLVVQAS